MKTDSTPVVAVIPNYNMSASLEKLLPQVLAQDYDQVFVIDDASTDGSRELLSRFKEITLIRGKTRSSPGANRNRILNYLNYDALIHFIDADVQLISSNNVDTARKLFADQTVGLAGGLISLPGNKPWMFNYGPRYSLYSMIGGVLQLKLHGSGHNLPLINYFLKELPDTMAKPEPKDVYWVGEANMIVPSKLFRAVNGFDEKLRYHEIQDLACKIHKLGYKARFEPSISVSHPEINLRAMVRRANRSRASRVLIKKYGLPLK